MGTQTVTHTLSCVVRPTVMFCMVLKILTRYPLCPFPLQGLISFLTTAAPSPQHSRSSRASSPTSSVTASGSNLDLDFARYCYGLHGVKYIDRAPLAPPFSHGVAAVRADVRGDDRPRSVARGSTWFTHPMCCMALHFWPSIPCAV